MSLLLLNHHYCHYFHYYSYCYRYYNVISNATVVTITVHHTQSKKKRMSFFIVKFQFLAPCQITPFNFRIGNGVAFALLQLLVCSAVFF